MVIDFDKEYIGETIYEVDTDRHEVINNYIITGFNYTTDGLIVNVIHPGTGYTFQLDKKDIEARYLTSTAVLTLLGVKGYD